MKLSRRLLAAVAAALLVLGPVACTTEDLPAGSGEAGGGEPGSDADMGPGNMSPGVGGEETS